MTTMTAYKIGRGKPPLETSFQPGNKEWQKREAKRQAMKERRFGDDVKAVLGSKVRVMQNGKSSIEIKLRGLIRKYMSEALSGSVSAANDLLSFRLLAADFGDMRGLTVLFEGSDAEGDD